MTFVARAADPRDRSATPGRAKLFEQARDYQFHDSTPHFAREQMMKDRLRLLELGSLRGHSGDLSMTRGEDRELSDLLSRHDDVANSYGEQQLSHVSGFLGAAVKPRKKDATFEPVWDRIDPRRFDTAGQWERWLDKTPSPATDHKRLLHVINHSNDDNPTDWAQASAMIRAGQSGDRRMLRWDPRAAVAGRPASPSVVKAFETAVSRAPHWLHHAYRGVVLDPSDKGHADFLSQLREGATVRMNAHSSFTKDPRIGAWYGGLKAKVADVELPDKGLAPEGHVPVMLHVHGSTSMQDLGGSIGGAAEVLAPKGSTFHVARVDRVDKTLPRKQGRGLYVHLREIHE
jgi:hypothetical protein